MSLDSENILERFEKFQFTPLVYDFEIAETVSDIQKILQQINDTGYKIIGIAPYDRNIAIFFMRPAHG